MDPKIHKIELGDIIQHGEWAMNDTLSLPAMYNIFCISTGNGRFDLRARPVRNLSKHFSLLQNPEPKDLLTEICDKFGIEPIIEFLQSAE